jgi:hypothetical protein
VGPRCLRASERRWVRPTAILLQAETPLDTGPLLRDEKRKVDSSCLSLAASSEHAKDLVDAIRGCFQDDSVSFVSHTATRGTRTGNHIRRPSESTRPCLACSRQQVSQRRFKAISCPGQANELRQPLGERTIRNSGWPPHAKSPVREPVSRRAPFPKRSATRRRVGSGDRGTLHNAAQDTSHDMSVCTLHALDAVEGAAEPSPRRGAFLYDRGTEIRLRTCCPVE